MERSSQSGDFLLYLIGAIIVGLILLFLIIRPGHALA
jgi:hypothetical protein